MSVPGLPTIIKTIVIIPIVALAIWAVVDFVAGVDL
jgi:hypothetical protein